MHLLDNMLIVLGPVCMNLSISGIHERNQSVINFLYETNLGDKMSGNTQG